MNKKGRVEGLLGILLIFAIIFIVYLLAGVSDLASDYRIIEKESVLQNNTIKNLEEIKLIQEEIIVNREKVITILEKELENKTNENKILSKKNIEFSNCYYGCKLELSFMQQRLDNGWN